MLFHPHLRGGEPGDKHIRKTVAKIFPGRAAGTGILLNETGPMARPERYAFRTLDRQWIVPDARLINQPNPALWDDFSPKQVFLTAPEDRTPTNGPSLSFTGLIPDLHHYHGRGGRAFPLWRDAAGTIPNLKPALLAHLAIAYGALVSAEDLMAYIAG